MGDISASMPILVVKDCDKPKDSAHGAGELGAGIIAGVVCAIFALIAAGVGFLIYK